MAAVTAFPSASDSPRSSGRSANFSNAVTSSVRLAAPSSAVIWSRILTCMAQLHILIARERVSHNGRSGKLGPVRRTPMPISLARQGVFRGCFGHEFALRTSLGNLVMSSIERAVTAVTAILVREGLDYLQSKAVFKAARQRAGLQPPPDRRAAIDRLTIEEELRFIDQAYVRSGRTGLLLQTLLETGARVSEFVQIRTEDVSLAERVIVIRRGKGGKRREVPGGADPARARPVAPTAHGRPPRRSAVRQPPERIRDRAVRGPCV